MAVTFLKRSSLPAAVKGKVGSLSVVIGGNGQVTLSSLATKALGGVSMLRLGLTQVRSICLWMGLRQ